jgi:O-antigen ligase
MFKNKMDYRRILLLLSVVTLAHAVGVILRHGLAVGSITRVGWNLAGLLAALAASLAFALLPKVSSIPVFACSSLIALASGSRNAVVFLVVVIVLVSSLTVAKWRMRIFQISLIAVLIMGLYVWGGSAGENVDAVLGRAERSVSFENADRYTQWSYWLDVCTEQPFGRGWSAVNTGVWAVPGHNGWLDIWATGGLASVVVFGFAQIAIGIALYQRRRCSTVATLAFGVFIAASLRGVFENLPIGTSYGMNGFAVVYLASAALAVKPLGSAGPSSTNRVLRRAAPEKRMLYR